MNTFYEHHKSSINFAYRCFDRILLNGLIQPFQQPERVIGFFNAYRNAERVIRNCLRDIAQQFQNWLKNRCEKWGAPVLDAPEGRRDDLFRILGNLTIGVTVGLVFARDDEPNDKSLGVLISNHLNHTQALVTELNYWTVIGMREHGLSNYAGSWLR